MIELKPCQERRAWALWRAGCTDADWPNTYRSKADFEAFFASCELASFLGTGGLYWIKHGQVCIGFAAAQRVFDGWAGKEEVTALEWGTYLFADWRGRNLNPSVKQRQIETAFDSYAADWCLFIVPNANWRARAAMKKIPRIQSTADVAEGQGLLIHLAKYRAYISGTPCEVYGIQKP